MKAVSELCMARDLDETINNHSEKLEKAGQVINSLQVFPCQGSEDYEFCILFIVMDKMEFSRLSASQNIGRLAIPRKSPV